MNLCFHNNLFGVFSVHISEIDRISEELSKRDWSVLLYNEQYCKATDKNFLNINFLHKAAEHGNSIFFCRILVFQHI